MIQKVVTKIKQWEKTIDNYDKAVIKATKITAQLSETQKRKGCKIESLEKRHENSILKIKQQDGIVRKLQKEAILIISDEIDDRCLKESFIHLLESTPEFAGLDEKAIESIDDGEPSLETITYAHQIYVEHYKMVADKILGSLS